MTRDRLLDREVLERAFDLLAGKLARRGVVGEVHVFDGAAMVLAFDARTATRDVDALFEPDRPVLQTLDVDTLEEVTAVVRRYVPDEPLSDRSRLLVEDLLAELDRPAG